MASRCFARDLEHADRIARGDRRSGPHADDERVALDRKAQALADAGLRRMNVSLDSLDETVFQHDERRRFPVSRCSKESRPPRPPGSTVKINAVVKRGVNDARRRHGAPLQRQPHTFRSSSSWTSARRTAGVSTTSCPPREIVERIDEVFRSSRSIPAYRGEVARRWRYRDGAGEIGVIASSQSRSAAIAHERGSRPRAGSTPVCSRFEGTISAPRSARARPKTSSPSRSGVWLRRRDRYSELRSEQTAAQPEVEMSYIGG